MLTDNEKQRFKRIAEMCNGNIEKVSALDRQWILNMYKREGYPVDKETFAIAKESGFDVEGIKVEGSD